MERRRTIAAAPVRSASEAWRIVSTLLADTLERSSVISVGSVAQELATLYGLGSALIAGGHLESKGLVLVDVGLHLTVSVITADAALQVEENLNPVPGGASATEGWILYLPQIGAFDAIIAEVVEKSAHLSADPPPTSAPATRAEGRSRESLIDVEALRKMETKQ